MLYKHIPSYLANPTNAPVGYTFIITDYFNKQIVMLPTLESHKDYCLYRCGSTGPPRVTPCWFVMGL